MLAAFLIQDTQFHKWCGNPNKCCVPVCEDSEETQPEVTSEELLEVASASTSSESKSARSRPDAHGVQR